MFGVEMSVRGEDEREVPWDGASPGRLLVRGPCVVSGYFGADAPAVDGGGWFDTGDLAVVHPDAVMQITDRAKDVIQSGGEWIRSDERRVGKECVSKCRTRRSMCNYKKTNDTDMPTENPTYDDK